jgi:DNA polymerase I
VIAMNMQNWPKREDGWVRALIVPPRVDHRGNGGKHLIASLDYGQIEPRVIAMSSRDKRLYKSFWDREDIHLEWAERIARKDPQALRRRDGNIKKLRQDVKSNWVLAGFYGAAWKNIRARLRLNDRCDALFEDFKAEFAGVWRWQDEQLEAYRRDGYVTCLTGRRRRAPLTLNQILNNTTQGAASDIVLDGMNRLSVLAEREDDLALHPVLNVHDDLTFYLPRRRKDELLEVIVHEMLHPAFDWVTVPLSVELSIGDNWADMRAVKTFFSDD